MGLATDPDDAYVVRHPTALSQTLLDPPNTPPTFDLHLSVAERRWLSARADVGRDLRAVLLGLLVYGDDAATWAASEEELWALDAVFLRGNVYTDKLSDGLLVATLAERVWGSLARLRGPRSLRSAAALATALEEETHAHRGTDDDADPDGPGPGRAPAG